MFTVSITRQSQYLLSFSEENDDKQVERDSHESDASQVDGGQDVDVGCDHRVVSLGIRLVEIRVVASEHS